MEDSFSIEIPLTISLRGIFRDGEEGYIKVRELEEYLQKNYSDLKIGSFIWDVEGSQPLDRYWLRIEIPVPEEVRELGQRIKNTANLFLRSIG